MGTSCINTILTLALSDAGVFLDEGSCMKYKDPGICNKAVNTTHIRCRCRSKCLLFITSVAYKLCPQPTSSSMVDLLQVDPETYSDYRQSRKINKIPSMFWFQNFYCWCHTRWTNDSANWYYDCSLTLTSKKIPNILSGIFLAFCSEASTVSCPVWLWPCTNRADNAQHRAHTTASAWSKEAARAICLCTPIILSEWFTAQNAKGHSLYICTRCYVKELAICAKRSCTSGSKANQ